VNSTKLCGTEYTGTISRKSSTKLMPRQFLPNYFGQGKIENIGLGKNYSTPEGVHDSVAKPRIWAA